MIEKLPASAALKLAGVLIRDYTGDNTNNRVIDLGDDYDLVVVFGASNAASTTQHGAVAVALGDTFNSMYRDAADFFHTVGVSVTTNWQGKMPGADAEKIKLGGVGGAQTGFNNGSKLYRILALKFAGVAP